VRVLLDEQLSSRDCPLLRERWPLILEFAGDPEAALLELS
jgi:hypothetical protein